MHMKTPAAFGVALVVGVGIGWFLSRLVENRAPDGNETQRSASPAEQAPTVNLTQAEKEELERLRKDVPDLLRLRGQLAQLRQATEGNGQTGTPQTRPSNAGRFIAAQQLRDVGLATPEASLQTFMASMVSGNIDGALAAAAPRPDGQSIDHTQVRQTSQQLSPFSGMQLIAKKVLSDDKVDIETLDFQEGKAPTTTVHHMVKVGAEWRYSDSTTAWPGWDREGQVETLMPE